MKVSEEEAPVSVEDIEAAPMAEAAPAASPTASQSSKAEPNEALFGGLLIFCLALSLIGATGYFGFSGYRYFKQLQAERSIPSIDSLPKAVVAEQPDPKAPPAQSATPEAKTATHEKPSIDKATLVVKVLNGGSAKGVAGAYGAKLKQAGFTKVTVGNSFGSYTGQTLYYAAGQESGANFLKEEILKTYPALVTKTAPAGDKDAAAATFVLILGR